LETHKKELREPLLFYFLYRRKMAGLTLQIGSCATELQQKLRRKTR
jgi:hypothetical protein